MLEIDLIKKSIKGSAKAKDIKKRGLIEASINLICPSCNSTDIIHTSGMFECQNCYKVID